MRWLKCLNNGLVSLSSYKHLFNMNIAESGAVGDAITVHDFSEKILEQTVHFHVIKLNGGFFLWVGSNPVLSNLAVSMESKFDSMPLSTLVLGDPSDTTPNSLAQRLSKHPFILSISSLSHGYLLEQEVLLCSKSGHEFLYGGQCVSNLVNKKCYSYLIKLNVRDG
uniref:Proteasome assembly chaperone 4 n=1 Tax=Oncorhynchus kisutch TaxID=8019 RepID=A0A8C7HHS2_ONCKI